MDEQIRELATFVAAIIDVTMVIIIVIGVIHTVWRIGNRVIRQEALAPAVREIWLHFAAWLLLALEFALAADLIETVVAPNWDEIGQLGAIAVIRIALGYFLGRDIAEMREPSASDA